MRGVISGPANCTASTATCPGLISSSGSMFMKQHKGSLDRMNSLRVGLG